MCDQNSRRVSGSTPEVGSSRNSTAGSCITAQARASRCLKPSGSSPALRPRYGPRPKHGDHAAGRLAPAAAGQAVDAGEEIEVLPDAQVAVERELLGHVAQPRSGRDRRPGRGRDPATRAEPDVGRSRPHIILNVVDLPAPLGPSRPKISPRPMRKRDPVGGGEVAEPLGQPVGLDDGVIALTRRAAGLSRRSVRRMTRRLVSQRRLAFGTAAEQIDEGVLETRRRGDRPREVDSALPRDSIARSAAWAVGSLAGSPVGCCAPGSRRRAPRGAVSAAASAARRPCPAPWTRKRPALDPGGQLLGGPS